MEFTDYDIRLLKEKEQGQENALYGYLSYRDMIDYFTDGCLILNNNLINIEINGDYAYWELENGQDYDEENDYYLDVYQYYIIDENDAERLKNNTHELIYYNNELDMYLLGVTHFGSSWRIVPSDFKKVYEDENYNYYKLEG